jgi:maleate isomerase
MTDTLAYRSLLGVLVPFFNTVLEPELADLRPPGVTNQTARFTLDANVLQNVQDAVAKLEACKPSAILIGLSTESFPGGLDVLEKAARAAATHSNRPVFTAPHATHAALRALGVRGIGVVTPFDAAANVHVRAAFEAQGFDVASIVGLSCPALDTIGHTSPDEIRGVFRAVDSPRAEALVQVGTGLPVLHLVGALEREFGKPVVACNAALYWQALRATNIDDRLPGFGRLLADR